MVGLEISCLCFSWLVRHSVTGPQRAAGPILKMSKTPPKARRSAPALGEHTRELLVELGIPAPEVEALAAEGVIVTS